MARVYETMTVLCLVGVLVLGMIYVLSALIDYQKSNLHTILSKYVKRSRSVSLLCYNYILKCQLVHILLR